jgi:hypothetical protein
LSIWVYQSKWASCAACAPPAVYGDGSCGPTGRRADQSAAGHQLAPLAKTTQQRRMRAARLHQTADRLPSACRRSSIAGFMLSKKSGATYITSCCVLSSLSMCRCRTPDWDWGVLLGSQYLFLQKLY